MRWGETVTLEFVKIYLKQECLWNPSHPGYKLKHYREKSYMNIINEFKTSTSKTLSVPEVKMKVKNLRTTYAQEVNKILHKSNPDSMYEPSLIWFHEMDRCLKNVPSNRHSTTYNTVSNISCLKIILQYRKCFVWTICSGRDRFLAIKLSKLYQSNIYREILGGVLGPAVDACVLFGVQQRVVICLLTEWT